MGKGILVIGDIFIDKYSNGNVFRVDPGSAMFIFDRDYTGDYSVLGGAGNVAANCITLQSPNSLPQEVRLAGILNDYYDLIDVAGLDTELIVSGQSMTKTRFCDVNSEKNFIRIDNTQKFKGDLCQRFEELIMSHDLSEYDVVVISDYDKGTVSEMLAKHIVAKARVVIVDTKKPWINCFYGARFLKLNKSEYKTCFDFLRQDPKKFPHILKTEGELGMSLFKQGKHFLYSPAIKHRVVDCSGAGDVSTAYVAAYVGKLLNPMHTMEINWKKLLLNTNIAAGLSTRKFGVATVLHSEIIKFQKP